MYLKCIEERLVTVATPDAFLDLPQHSDYTLRNTELSELRVDFCYS